MGGNRSIDDEMGGSRAINDLPTRESGAGHVHSTLSESIDTIYK